MTSILKRGSLVRYPALPAIVLNVSALPNDGLEPIFERLASMPGVPGAETLPSRALGQLGK